MYRIIGQRASGKTRQLLQIAKETGATIVCANPDRLREKANYYGFQGLKFISFKDANQENFKLENRKFLIDELEEYIKYYMPKELELIGYSMTNEG